MVAVVIHVSRQGEPGGQVQLPLHHLGLDKLLQVCAAQTPVPVICDVTTIHDLTEQVAQVIVRHLGDYRAKAAFGV